MPPDAALRERSVLLILLGVQFTHLMDFMVLMPLGPQFMRIWDISPAQFAILVSAYTLSAAVASVLCGFYVDRFDRRRALLLIYGGFAASTLLCAAAPDFGWLLAARTVTGAFGGIAGAAVYSIVGDVVPDARRGTAMGIVMTAFPISAVAGVPLGLTLANIFDWRAPFVFLAAVSLAVLVLATWLLPRMDAHVAQARSTPLAGCQIPPVFSKMISGRAPCGCSGGVTEQASGNSVAMASIANRLKCDICFSFLEISKNESVNRILKTPENRKSCKAITPR